MCLLSLQNGDHKFQSFSRVDIEVTGEQEHTCSLQVSWRNGVTMDEGTLVMWRGDCVMGSCH